MKNLILTTYFTKEIDPQRSWAWAVDDFDIIRPFYDSVCKHGLDLIVLHDNCSDDFVSKYTTDKISFVKVDSSGSNMVDIRWELYSKLLPTMKIDNLFVMDVSDVIVLKNPFEFMTSDMVYAGDEVSINRENDWMLERYELLQLDTADYLDDVVLNCGVLGGNSKDMLDISIKMSNIVSKNPNKDLTVDMAAANHILYTDYRDRLAHGQPITTFYRGGVNPYSGDDNGSKYCYIQHK